MGEKIEGVVLIGVFWLFKVLNGKRSEIYRGKMVRVLNVLKVNVIFIV